MVTEENGCKSNDITLLLCTASAVLIVIAKKKKQKKRKLILQSAALPGKSIFNRISLSGPVPLKPCLVSLDHQVSE